MKGGPLPPLRFDTVSDALRAAAAHADCGLTFIDGNERETWVSWPDVYQRARRTAATLCHLGIDRGDRVIIALPTSPAFVDVFFGTLLAGATPVPVSPPPRLGGIDEQAIKTRMLAAVGARLAIADQRSRPLLDTAARLGGATLGCVTAEEVQDLCHGDRHDVAAADALALIQFSSGSTVDPKPIALSHRQIMSQCTALTTLMPARDAAAQIGVSWLPLHHDMGLIGPLLTSVCYGRYRMALIRPEHVLARPALWLRAIARHRAELSPAPNFAYALCLRRVADADLAGADLSCWRYALNGSEPISMDVMRRFAGRFAAWGFNPHALMPVYGLAEAALAVTFTSPEEPVRSIGIDQRVLAATGEIVAGPTEVVAVGAPVPGCEVEIRDADGRAVPDRRMGQIVVRSASLMTGYYNDHDATDRVLDHGWLQTGDLGFVADGDLYISGRAKDVVIVRGANHTSESLEACVDGIDGVRPGAAVAVGYVPEGSDGEELLLLVERLPRADPAHDATIAQQIHAAVLERAGVRAHAVHVLAYGALPRTSSGKLRRGEARRLFVAGAFDDAVGGSAGLSAAQAPR